MKLNNIKLVNALIVLMLLPCTSFAEVNIELNKVEQINDACRVFLVIKNNSNYDFNALKPDIVLFNQDDVIHKNMAIELAPLEKKKKSVKAFDLKNYQCANLSSLLVNKFIQCDSITSNDLDCMSLIHLTTKNNILITK